MIVDTHIHPLAPDEQKYPRKPVGIRPSDWSIGASLTPEQFLEHMAAAGVDQATLVQASTVHGYDNTYVVESCRRYPDRFVGVCCIDPLAPGAADTLSSWIGESGLRGLRLFTVAPTVPETHWLDQPEVDPVWVRAGELGIPVDIQINQRGLGMVRNVLERYPNVNMILDHLAGVRLEDGPPYEQAAAFFDLARFPNLYLKFSPHNTRAAAQGASSVRAFFEALLGSFGADRLMWGSNFPATRGSDAAPYKEIVEESLEALAFLTPEDRERAFAGTARQLYPDLARARPV